MAVQVLSQIDFFATEHKNRNEKRKVRAWPGTPDHAPDQNLRYFPHFWRGTLLPHFSTLKTPSNGETSIFPSIFDDRLRFRVGSNFDDRLSRGLVRESRGIFGDLHSKNQFFA